MVLDSSKARRLWQWRPTKGTTAILDEIAEHARGHPEWLEVSAPF
jgi:CDP-paratose 2-epimerase